MVLPAQCRVQGLEDILQILQIQLLGDLQIPLIRRLTTIGRRMELQSLLHHLPTDPGQFGAIAVGVGGVDRCLDLAEHRPGADQQGVQFIGDGVQALLVILPVLVLGLSQIRKATNEGLHAAVPGL